MRARTIPSDMKPWVVLNITESKERREEEGYASNAFNCVFKSYSVHFLKEELGSKCSLNILKRLEVHKNRTKNVSRGLKSFIDGFMIKYKPHLRIHCKCLKTY